MFQAITLGLRWPLFTSTFRRLGPDRLLDSQEPPADGGGALRPCLDCQSNDLQPRGGGVVTSDCYCCSHVNPVGVCFPSPFATSSGHLVRMKRLYWKNLSHSNRPQITIMLKMPTFNECTNRTLSGAPFVHLFCPYSCANDACFVLRISSIQTSSTVSGQYWKAPCQTLSGGAGAILGL